MPTHEVSIVFQVIFQFDKYVDISEIDSAIDGLSVNSISVGCNAGAALVQAQSALFAGDGEARHRIMILLMSSSSDDDVSAASGPLESAGIQVSAIGMDIQRWTGGYQVIFPTVASYLLTAELYHGLSEAVGGTSALISRGRIFLFQDLSCFVKKENKNK